MALSLAASNPNPAPSDGELLDAYSSTIATVADRVGPAVGGRHLQRPRHGLRRGDLARRA